MTFVSIQFRFISGEWAGIAFANPLPLPMGLFCPLLSYLTRSSILVMSDGVLMLNMLRWFISTPWISSDNSFKSANSCFFCKRKEGQNSSTNSPKRYFFKTLPTDLGRLYWRAWCGALWSVWSDHRSPSCWWHTACGIWPALKDDCKDKEMQYYQEHIMLLV